MSKRYGSRPFFHSLRKVAGGPWQGIIPFHRHEFMARLARFPLKNETGSIRLNTDFSQTHPPRPFAFYLLSYFNYN